MYSFISPVSFVPVCKTVMLQVLPHKYTSALLTPPAVTGCDRSISWGFPTQHVPRLEGNLLGILGNECWCSSAEDHHRQQRFIIFRATGITVKSYNSNLYLWTNPGLSVKTFYWGEFFYVKEPSSSFEVLISWAKNGSKMYMRHYTVWDIILKSIHTFFTRTFKEAYNICVCVCNTLVLLWSLVYEAYCLMKHIYLGETLIQAYGKHHHSL